MQETQEAQGPVQADAAQEPGGEEKEAQETQETQGPVQQSAEITPNGAVRPSGEQILADYLSGVDADTAGALRAAQAGAQREMEAGEALGAYLRGDTLSPQNREKIAAVIDDPDIRGNLLFPNPEMQELAAENEMIARQASEAEWKAFNEGTMQRMNALGRQIGKAADMLESRSIPEDMRNDGLMLLAGVMQEAKRKVEAGEIAVPAGENLYDYALSTDETLQSQVQQVLDLQKTVQEIQEQNAVEAALAREKQLEAAQARFQAGNATETDVALLAGREEAQSMDVNRGVETDALRMNYHMQLAGTISTYYADSGDYWKGESAAAAEAARIEKTGGDATEFTALMRETTNALIDEMTRAAHSYGMDLKTYLSGVGMTLDDLMDIGYNRIQRDGHAALEDEELQAAMSALENAPAESVGMGTAALSGAAHGSLSYLSDFLNTPYQALDLATYESRREMVMWDFTSRYGVSAPQMYKQALLAYADSGALSEESAQALLANIERAQNIFDVAYEIDPGFVSGLYRQSVESLKKTTEELERNMAYATDAERAVFGGVSGLFYNLPAMAVSTLSGGAAGALGAGKRAASAVGTAIGFGIPGWGTSYAQARKTGMSSGTAAAWALGSSTLTVLANMGGTGSAMDLYAGRASAQAGLASALHGNGRFDLLKGMSRQLVRRGLEEGKEEIRDTAMQYAYGLSQDAVLAMDRGEEMTFSKFMGSVVRSFEETDVEALGREILAAGAGGAVYGMVFSLVGIGANAMGARQTAQMENRYPSLKLAAQIANGEKEATEATLGEFAQALQSDLQSPEYRRYVDRGDAGLRTLMNTATAAMQDTGAEKREGALRESRKADDYEKKAAAAGEAAQEQKEQYMAAREAALNGDVEAAKKLEGYRTGWAKAATAQQEYTDAAEKARRSAAHNTADWLSECQQEARTTLAAQQREDASREMHAARDALGAAIQERKEREAGSLDERIRALDSQMADLENQIVEAYERGLDEDTLEALDTQMSEMAARQEELAERRNAGPGAADGQRAGETPGPQEAPNAQEEAARQEDEWAEAAREEADALRPVWRRLQSTPVYVDAAQASGILHKTGLSSIRQVNTRYGLKLRTDASRQRPDLSLDSLWNDLAGQAGGYMDAQSAHPEEALIDLMERSQAALGEADMAPYLPEGMTAYSAREAGTAELASLLHRQTGLEMVTAPLADGVRALYDRPNGRLVISSRIGAGERARQVVLHELTHYIENTAGYGTYAESALEAAYDGDEAAMERDAQEIREQYAEAGISLGRDGVYSELVAQATEKVVDAAGKMTGTGSENLVYELLGKRMSLPIRLYTRLNQFLARRRAQKQGTIRQYDALVRARDNLKTAIAQAGKWQKGMGGQDATLELDERNRASGKIRTGTEQTQMQLAIEYDRNNRPFVVVEEDILEGVPKEEWIDKVKETMAQKFPEGIRVGNNIIRISRKTRKEWTRSKNSSWLRYNDADAYADKMRAAGNADEIIRASGDYVNESINHERKDGIVDFARGRVRLSIGGRDYSASVIIGNNMDNALTLYDIVDMKAEHIEKKTQQTDSSRSLLDRSTASSSNINIAQGDADVNTQSMQNGVQYALEYDRNNRPYVVVEEDILEGVEPKDWAKTAKRVLKERFPNGVTVGNRLIQITGKSRGEFTESKYTRWLKNNEPAEYADKLRAAGNADEILYASDEYVNEGLNHPRNDHIVDFARGSVRMEIGDNTYEASVVVGQKDDGDLILYDVVNLEKTALKKKTQRTAGHQSAPHDRSAASSLDPSIAQSDADVNTQSMQNGEQYALAPRQFATGARKTVLEKADWTFDEVKQILGDLERTPDSNRAQFERAKKTLDEAGYEAAYEALLSMQRDFTADDNMLGALLMVEARERGDLLTQTMIATRLREEAGKQGRNLQSWRGIAKLTPEGAMASAVKRADDDNVRKGLGKNAFPVGHEPPKKTAPGTPAGGTPAALQTLRNTAERVALDLSSLSGNVSRENKWNLPLSETQRGLIRQYGLEGTELAGMNYNRATRKQRMLAAILAADPDINGDALLTLTQQLEGIRAGHSVVTDADLAYIHAQMSEMMDMEGGETSAPRTRAGKTALGRAMDAQSNLLHVSGFVKTQAIRFAHMLSSPATAVRNTLSNVLMEPMETASEAVAEIADRIVSQKTGNRTTALPSRRAVSEGRRAFAREIAQTFADYFVTHTDTSHSRRYEVGEGGRIFENNVLETYRNLVDFAMQIGDRPFYERCFTQEMDTLQRLETKTRDRETGQMRPMTQEEMRQEATMRALERVFQEDSLLTRKLNEIKNENPAMGAAISLIVPFTRTPTNIAPIRSTWSAGSCKCPERHMTSGDPAAKADGRLKTSRLRSGQRRSTIRSRRKQRGLGVPTQVYP